MSAEGTDVPPAVADSERSALLVAQVSHELRSPLQGILGLTELVLASSLDGEQRELLGAVRSEAQRLRTLIDDLLDYSAGQAGKLELAVEATRVPGIFDRIDDVVGHWLQPGVDLRVDLDPGVPELVMCDGNRIRQIVLNLVSNAAKNTSSGWITVAVGWDAPFLVVSVSDTGRGIRPEDIERVFAPYQRSDVDASIPGSGLGLTISQQILRSMGSRLECVSELGQGSQFSFRVETPAVAPVPGGLDPEAPGGRSGNPKGAQPHRPGEKVLGADLSADRSDALVLVVDDTLLNRTVVRRQLERLGVKVLEATGAREAIALLQHNPVDLVFMDWHMPDIDGIEATHLIRRLEEPVANVPIVALTASALAGDRERCLAAGMNDYLPKPATIDHIAAALNRWVPESEEGATGSKSGDTLANLVADLGSAEVVVNLVDTFLETLGASADEVLDGLGRSDPLAVARAAHSLKSSAALLGCTPLASVCADFEREGRAGRVVGSKAEFEEAACEARLELERWAVIHRSTVDTSREGDK